MTLTNSSLIFLVAAVGCILNRCQPGPLSVDEIVQRNTQAMGGRMAIEAVKAIEVDLHIADPGFEVDGKYWAARPGRMRIDIFADGKRLHRSIRWRPRLEMERQRQRQRSRGRIGESHRRVAPWCGTAGENIWPA